MLLLLLLLSLLLLLIIMKVFLLPAYVTCMQVHRCAVYKTQSYAYLVGKRFNLWLVIDARHRTVDFNGYVHFFVGWRSLWRLRFRRLFRQGQVTFCTSAKAQTFGWTHAIAFRIVDICSVSLCPGEGFCSSILFTLARIFVTHFNLFYIITLYRLEK